MAHSTRTIKGTALRNDENKAQKSLFQQMREDQKAASDFLNGKITKEELDARGIKFAKPI